MKITSVEINPEGSSNVCVLSFRDPRRLNPYNVTGIVGLDAEEIAPKYYGSSIDASKKFYNMSLERRDIVVRIELNPDFSVDQSYSDLRDELYRLIASSRTGVLWLNFKNVNENVAAISGRVTKFEAAHFAKTPEAQITIKCDDPMLRALVPTEVPVAGLDPAATTITDSLSTAPHGFAFEMGFVAPVAAFGIYEPSLDWGFVVTPSGGFIANDVLYFSSEDRNKYVYMIRGGVTTYLADKISNDSAWPLIFPGENDFICLEPADMAWNAISYYPTYWGV